MVEPDTGEPYERDPRGTALKAEAYLKSSGIGDAAYMGPEAEFFIFDDVRWSTALGESLPPEELESRGRPPPAPGKSPLSFSRLCPSRLPRPRPRGG